MIEYSLVETLQDNLQGITMVGSILHQWYDEGHRDCLIDPMVDVILARNRVGAAVNDYLRICILALESSVEILLASLLTSPTFATA